MNEMKLVCKDNTVFFFSNKVSSYNLVLTLTVSFGMQILLKRLAKIDTKTTVNGWIREMKMRDSKECGKRNKYK